MASTVRLLLFLVVSFPSSALAHLHPHLKNSTDRHSLLQVKAAITHDPLHSLADWNPNISFCNWTGVKCNSGRERVVGLNISGMELEGSISPFLANLSSLRSLDLSDNSLHGLIPPQLGRLLRLKVLYLGVNNLTGTIPSSLSNISTLTELDLSLNMFTGAIPRELGLLSNLQLIYLYENYLTGQIPTPLSNCKSLQQLVLHENQLTGSIPQELGLLAKLSVLTLWENQLTGNIPSSLSNISTLTVLDIDSNKFEGIIPRELGLLSNLQVLQLHGNQLTGGIPSSLSNITTLVYLYISSNRLVGAIPRELGLLSNLQLLHLYGNQLTGDIPSSLSNISTLVEIEISTNRLAGAIPRELGLLSNLQLLYLFENYLTGQIPTSLSNCTSLQQLGLSDNQLNGPIPKEFGTNWFQLEWLSLYGNLLSGNIPISLGNCSKLKGIDAGRNRLSGEVPIQLGNLLLLERLGLEGNGLVSSNTSTSSFLTALTNCSHLYDIDLSHNQLGGMLPLSIGHLPTKVSHFDLGYNNIGGNIPHQIGNLTNITYLSLSNNLLYGNIPTSIKKLQKLEQLYLQRNRLDGSLPSEMGELKGLGLLSAGHNSLSGRIPASLADLPQLRRLSLNHNQFSGNIPPTLGQCKNLELLDLSHNRLDGRIPEQVAGLQNLQFYLNLSYNSLQGSLPPEIGKITMAQAIDVSVNQLTGIIPEALGSCIALAYINLSRNAFRGPIPSSLAKLENLEDMDLSFNHLSGTIPESFNKLKMLHYVDFSFNNLKGEISEDLFANRSIIALFEGNSGLCGPHMYSLPACTEQRNPSLSKKIMVIIVAIIGFMLLCLIAVVYRFLWMRESLRRNLNLSKLLSIIEKKLGYPRISYEELVIATGGFDDRNLLGVGNFGSVYKGIMRDGTIVAIKVLNLQNEEAHNSFVRECKVLGKVRHKNLIRIITSCSNPSFKALVLQFMSNGSLEKHLYPDADESNHGGVCGLSFRERLNIAIDIAHGMSYLHHHGFVQVVHCDLKPSNVLLDDNMTAHVTDFGIARLIGASSMGSLTSTLALRGSIGYIAPEYGFSATVSTNGDVYSYGTVILEMLTGKRPTDNIFVDGLTLLKWVSMALPSRILEVVDGNLLTYPGDEAMGQNDRFDCLIQDIHLALWCTNESPGRRPGMREIVEVLERIRETSLGMTRVFLLQSDLSYLLSLMGLGGLVSCGDYQDEIQVQNS